MTTVFISYANLPENTEIVAKLAHALKANGIDVRVDTDVHMVAGPLEGWPQWMKKNIRRADLILILFDAIYRCRYEGQEEADKGLGATWEGRIFTHELYSNSGKNRRFIPLIVDDASPDLIPIELRGTTFYRIPSQVDTLIQAIAPFAHVSLPTENIARLQPPATDKLIGRVDFKENILRAVENDAISVLAIIADGGFGKTALVYDWLIGFDASKYDIGHIFTWPFLTVETRQPSTSSEFFINAYSHFNVTPQGKEINVEEDKANYLIEQLKTHKSIVVLDGIESFQDPVDSETTRRGAIFDQAISCFLHSICTIEHAKQQSGRLVIVTSRISPVGFKGLPGYREIGLSELSRVEGRSLLRELGVNGEDVDLESATSEFEGHCLSLVLLAKIIVNRFRPDCDINNRFQVCDIVKCSVPAARQQIEQAKRIMEFYEKEVKQEKERVVLKMIGLFHSPMLVAQRDCLTEHAKFASSLALLTPEEWSALEQNLESYSLLVHEDGARTKYDAHPIVREHFRDRLEADSEMWRDAHKVLFDYFQKKAGEEAATLPELIPLYRAVHHGCLAHRYKEALSLYKTRILRGEAHGFSTNWLGAATEDIACLQRFLDTNPKVETPEVAPLDQADTAFVWARMAFCKMALGRLDESIYYRKRQLSFCEQQNDRQGAASALEQLSAVRILTANLDKAEEAANRAVDLAIECRNRGEELKAVCRQGAVIFLKGNVRKALEKFNYALSIQGELNGTIPWLILDYGFYFRLLLLEQASTKDDYEDILHNAEGVLNGPDQSWRAPMGLDHLIKAVALFKLGKMGSAREVFEDAYAALKESGFVIFLPYFFSFKAEFLAHIHDIDSCLKHLNEAARLSKRYGLPFLEAETYL